MPSIRNLTSRWWFALTVALVATTMPAVGTPCVLSPLDTTPRPLATFDAPQRYVSVAALSDGGFVVAFEEGRTSAGVILPEPTVDGRDGDRESVVIQRLDNDGLPIGEPTVATLTVEGAQSRPEVVADPRTGGFAVAWLHDGQPRLRRFGSSGAAISDEIVVSSTDHFADTMRAAVDRDGHAMVVWEPLRDSTQEPIVLTTAVGADGSVGALHEIAITSGERTPHRPQVIARSTGGFFVAWSAFDSGAAWGRSFAADGTPDGDVIELGAIGQITDLVLDAPSLAWAATARRFSRPAAITQLDLGSGDGLVYRPIADATSGRWTRLTAAAGDCNVVAFDTADDGYRLRGLDAAGEPAAGPDMMLPGPPWDPVEIAASLPRQPRTTVVATWVAGEQVQIARGRIGSPRLLLGDQDRFEVRVQWRDSTGLEGEGVAVPLTSDTGAFWFFDRENLELTVKILDGRALNGHFWVFNGSLTDVAYTVTVLDRASANSYQYTNPLGQFGSFGDTEALPAN